jgi:hypothetical protein
MTREEALKLIKETETDYTQKQHILLGLQILAKYDDYLDCSFEHDQMYVCDFDASIEKMTEEDVRLLASYGWIESVESWSHY